MRGKICVVTGANRGIGRATAAGLAARGATVVMMCRDRRAAEEAAEKIRQETKNPAIEVLPVDLASQTTIRRAAEEFLARYDRLDVLVNNAGVVVPDRRVTDDGLELQFAVNHLAPFLLTQLFSDRLRASAPARVVTVSSEVHRVATLDLDDLQATDRYGQFAQYAKTKLMNVLFTRELARRLDGSRVTANCLHPGVTATDLARALTPLPGVLARPLSALYKSPTSGAATSIYVAAAAELEAVTGRYFVNRRERQPAAAARDERAQRMLWDASERLTG